MKKIFILVLAVVFLLPQLPVFAADKTTVYVAGYNDFSENLPVGLKTGTGFIGATIYVGDSIIYEFEASGSGFHTAYVPISQIEKPGEVDLRVVSHYGSSDETYEGTVNLVKMGVETTDINYSKYNVQLQLSENGAGGLQKIDDNTAQISFSPKSSGDHRLGYNSPAEDTYASGANMMVDFEIMFKNGTSDGQETPLGTLNMAFRQDYKYQASGFPLSSTGGFPPEHQSMTLFYGGKFCGNYEYLTNVWYKCRVFFDMASKNDDGTLSGGIFFYIAEEENGEYSEFKLMKAYPTFTLNSLMQFRFEPRSAGGEGSITFKNVKIIRQEPKPVWYLDNAECTNEKITLGFSDDFEALTTENVKLFNRLTQNENGEIIPEEILIRSITKVESGKFEIIPEKALLYGKDYEIRLANGLKSAENATGYTEPDEDENGDGYWTVKTVTAPKYALNVKNLYKEATAMNVTFNNPNAEGGKFAAATWLGEGGKMVDFTMDTITAGDNESQEFLRSNSAVSEKENIIIFEIETNSESENFGGIKILEIK